MWDLLWQDLLISLCKASDLSYCIVASNKHLDSSLNSSSSPYLVVLHLSDRQSRGDRKHDAINLQSVSVFHRCLCLYKQPELETWTQKHGLCLDLCVFICASASWLVCSDAREKQGDSQKQLSLHLSIPPHFSSTSPGPFIRCTKPSFMKRRAHL